MDNETNGYPDIWGTEPRDLLSYLYLVQSDLIEEPNNPVLLGWEEALLLWLENN